MAAWAWLSFRDVFARAARRPPQHNAGPRSPGIEQVVAVKVDPVEREDARQLTAALMAEHGLTAAGWRFAWGHGKRKLGSAELRRHRSGHVTRTLRLSRHLVELNGEAAVRDVVLHEIAHALVGVEHGHSAAWRAMCVKLGCRPARLADPSVKVPAAPLAVWCGICETVIAERHRAVDRRRLAMSYCKACGPGSRGKLRCGPVDLFAGAERNVS